MALTNTQIDDIAGPADYFDRRVFARAIESATLAAQVERATQSQPVPHSQFGSPELGAMILARCVEKDQQPVQPEGPMAETVEQAARDVAKCLNERDGQGLDLRHVAMLVHYAQQPVQEPVQEPVQVWCDTCEGSGSFHQEHQAGCHVGGIFDCPDCDGKGFFVRQFTSPQAQPQPVQEPVAWRILDKDPLGCGDDRWVVYTQDDFKPGVCPTDYFNIEPLYTSPQAQPQPLTETQADALNTLCKMMHSGEEVEGDDGLAMLVPMDLWNEAQEAVELLIGEDDGTEAAHGITKGTT